MKRIESNMDYVRNTVTYELPDGRWATFDASAIEKFGIAGLLKYYGVEMPTERVPVLQYGRRIGTLPPGFDPQFARSTSFIYDVRPGDFTRERDHWVLGRTMGTSDVDCVAGFVRDPGQSTPNAETIAALQEADAGGGEVYRGRAEEAFEKILAEGDAGDGGQGAKST